MADAAYVKEQEAWQLIRERCFGFAESVEGPDYQRPGIHDIDGLVEDLRRFQALIVEAKSREPFRVSVLTGEKKLPGPREFHGTFHDA